MSESSGKQSGGINIDDADVTIGGDVIGRDRIEYRYGEDRFSAIETYYEGGCLARILMIVGALAIGVGFLGFFGGVGLSMLSMPSGSFSEVQSLIPLVVAGFGVIFVGIIISAVGRTLALRKAYRQQRRRPPHR